MTKNKYGLLLLGALSLSTAAFAGGYDHQTPSMMPHGFHFGLDTGAGAIAAFHTSNFLGEGNNTDVQNKQPSAITAASAAIPVGANIGYMFPLSSNNLLDFTISGEYFITRNKYDYAITNQAIVPTGSNIFISGDNENITKYTLLVSIKHMLSRSFDVFAGLGPTWAHLDNSVTTTVAATGAPFQVRNYGSKAYNLFGAELNLGVDYWMSKHLYWTLDLSNAVYAPSSLDTLTDVDSADTSELKQRRLNLYIPTANVSFNVLI